MMHQRQPWSAVVPWSQILGADGQPWTVMPNWPPYQKRIMRQGGPVLVFTPRPTDTATVLVPEDSEALAILAATFGPLELLGEWRAPAAGWTCPMLNPDTVDAHLRDWHKTLETGPTFHHTRSSAEALAYHWQVHQQQLVMPTPGFHVHIAN